MNPFTLELKHRSSARNGCFCNPRSTGEDKEKFKILHSSKTPSKRTDTESMFLKAKPPLIWQRRTSLKLCTPPKTLSFTLKLNCNWVKQQNEVWLSCASLFCSLNSFQLQLQTTLIVALHWTLLPHSYVILTSEYKTRVEIWGGGGGGKARQKGTNK